MQELWLTNCLRKWRRQFPAETAAASESKLLQTSRYQLAEPQSVALVGSNYMGLRFLDMNDSLHRPEFDYLSRFGALNGGVVDASSREKLHEQLEVQVSVVVALG